MKNKTIVVTGGSGFIPSHLIKALKKEQPKEIINLDLKTGYNLTEYREMEAFFEQNKIDIVFDLATLPLPMSLKQPYKVVNDITKMMLNLCELQRLGMFGKLVHLSSSEAYGNAQDKIGNFVINEQGEHYEYNVMSEDHPLRPRTPYASAKASADLLAYSYFITFGSDIIIPRSFNAYGPGQPLKLGAIIPKTINSILNKEQPAIYNKGLQTRDFVFVKDIAKSIIEITKTADKGSVVNIGTGIETTIYDLVHLICKLMGYKGEIKYIEQRAGDVSRHRADNFELFKLTGYIPDTTLEEGLQETIGYYIKLHHS